MGSIQSEIQKAKEAMDESDFDTAREICINAMHATESSNLKTFIAKERLEVFLILSDICKHQERLFDNINYLIQLTKEARAINDREMVAKGLIRIGFVFNKMGKRERAMKRFIEAEEITKSFENKIQYGYALAGKANVYWRTGENLKAIELAQKVLEIGLQNDEFILTAGAANIMSTAWFEMGNFDEALKVAKLSVETYRNSENKSDLARALNNQGEIYKRIKEYDRAIESYQEGLTVLDEKSVKRFGYLYTNMAECYTRLDNPKDSKFNLDKAKQFLRDSEDKYAKACLWYVCGILEDANNKTDNGLDWLRKAEKRMDELSVPYDLGVIRMELSRLYLKSGQKEQASEIADKAIEVLEKAGAMDLVEEIREMLD